MVDEATPTPTKPCEMCGGPGREKGNRFCKKCIAIVVSDIRKAECGLAGSPLAQRTIYTDGAELVGRHTLSPYVAGSFPKVEEE
jgi:hypothetical protein